MTEKSRKPQKMPRNQDGRKLKRADDSKTSPNKNGATIQTLTSSALPKLTENKLPVRARTSSIDSSCSSVSDTSVALDLPFSEPSPEQISPRAGGGKRLSIDSLSTGNFVSRRPSEESGDRVSSWWNNTSSGMGPGPTNPDWTMERSRRSSRSSWSTLVSASDSQLDDGEIEDGGSANVSVVVRVRPLSEQETKRGDHNVVLVQTPQSLLVEGDKNKQFTFNHVFDGEATQQDVLDECGMKKLVDMALEGYNCTAFAYGQTGSGKTYTITGPQKADGGRHYQDTSAWGLIQHSLVYLFDKMRLQPKVSFYIKTSYLEIYNEQVKDLLNLTGKDSLPVRWSKDKGFYVENLFIMECETLDDMLAVLEEGLSQKAIATNNVNEHSSRSHTIMSVSIDSELPDPDDNDLYITKHGKLSFVDLAGSEKVKELGSSSELLSETTNINKSLLTLGNCISSLSDNRKRSGHIPYRDSKLTKLLADSLGGTGITLMIACISPSSYCLSESINTLRYAVRARRIKNKPVIRMDPREKLITSLKREVRLLRSENQYLRQRLEFPGTAQPSFRPVQEPNNNHQQQHLPLESVNDGDLTPVPNGRMVEEPRIERTEAPMEGSRGRGGGPKDPGPVQRDTQVQAKSAADNSLYEMLQEYMVENETLRSENSDLHSVKEKARREQDSVARENDRLLKKLEELERVFTTSPYSLPSTFNSRTSSGQSIGMRGNNQPSPLGLLHQSPPLKTQRSPQGQLQRSPQGQANGLTHQNSLEKRPSGGSPWRQQSGELPPVDGIKGIPDNYRSSQQRQPLLPGQRDAPPTQRSFPSMSTQPPHHPPPTNHSYPRAHTNQSGLLNSTHPPLGHGQPPSHRGSKKGSDSRVSNTSQSYPPPPGSLQASYAGSMGPLHEDHQQAPPPVSKRDTSVSVRSSLSNPSVISKPQSKADIYIPSAPSTGLTKDTSQRRDPAVRHDLQTIEETGAHPASTYRNPPPLNNHPTVAGSHSNPSLRKPPSKPVSTANTAATGYSNKSKKNAWSGAGGSGTGGGGGVGGGVSQPSKNTTASSVPINNIPKTPAVTPPVVKYKPQGSNKMLAATTNNLDINYKGPDSDSLKDLNQKLREELQALDGEIEYMKYVNKNKPNAPAGKGKRR